MIYRKRDDEIYARLDELEQQRAIWKPATVTTELCDMHRDGINWSAPNPDDVEFMRCAAYSDTRRAVTACINKRLPNIPDADETQIAFPGFEYVRSRYVFERDGELISAPIELMKRSEIEAKADEYDKQSVTLRNHAAELRRYVSLINPPECIEDLVEV